MSNFKKTNIDPAFTETLEIDNDKYTLINSGTKHSGIYSVKSSRVEIDKNKAMLWMYENEYDQVFIFFPELQVIVDNAQLLTQLTNSQYDMYVKIAIWGGDLSVYDEFK